jgi:transposase
MAAPLVSDALWSLFGPLLPPRPPRPNGGRPPIGERAALTGILFVLKSGIPWEMLPQEMGCGSGMTCWRRLRDWQEAGIWQAFHHTLLDRLGRAGLIDWSRCSLDAASLPAKAGGAATGPNPTDRGKPGSKRHLVVDRQGIPLAVLPTAANVHDSTVLEEALDAVPAIRQPRGRPRRRPAKLHADEAYDYPLAAAPAGDAASFPGSRGAGSRAASAWAGTGGWWSVPWPGSPAAAGWWSATSAATTSTSPSSSSPAPRSASASSRGSVRRSKFSSR